MIGVDLTAEFAYYCCRCCCSVCLDIYWYMLCLRVVLVYKCRGNINVYLLDIKFVLVLFMELLWTK